MFFTAFAEASYSPQTDSNFSGCTPNRRTVVIGDWFGDKVAKSLNVGIFIRVGFVVGNRVVLLDIATLLEGLVGGAPLKAQVETFRGNVHVFSSKGEVSGLLPVDIHSPHSRPRQHFFEDISILVGKAIGVEAFLVDLRRRV